MDEVFKLADRITVLRDGKLVDSRLRADATPRDITHLMVGREIESTQLGQGRQRRDVVLEVDRLSLPWTGHARQWRLCDVSFKLHAGEIVGIAGLMGAGRTELLECLFGASAERHTGKILLRGESVDFRHPAEAKASGIALVTEDRKRSGLFSHLNVRENITTCTLGRATSVGLIRKPREHLLANEIIEQLRVKTAGPEAAITSLSGGNQQKTIIGRWLLTRPDVLLLDDPTRGVDVGAKAEMYRLMDELCRAGLAILVTSSELPELLTVCDRILVLCEGRLTGEFTRSQATEQGIMEAATRRASVA
jgi:ABC-type sugar transport system ATPase subunit